MTEDAVHQHSNGTPITKTLRNQISHGWQVELDATIVEMLAMSAEIIQKKKKRVQAPGNNAGVQAVSCDLELPAIAYVLSPRIALGETDERGTVEITYTGTE